MKDTNIDNRRPYGFTQCKALKSARNPDSYGLLEMLVEQIVWCGQAPDEGKQESSSSRAFNEQSTADGSTDGNMFPILDVRHFSRFIFPVRDCLLSCGTCCRSKLPVSPPSLLPYNVLLLKRLAKNADADSEMC